MRNTDKPAPITRPNGKPYRPRWVAAEIFTGHDEEFGGVVVFGTHDIEVARLHAQPIIDAELGYGYFEHARVSKVWWHDGMQAGRRMFLDDDLHGRAGVSFDVQW